MTMIDVSGVNYASSHRTLKSAQKNAKGAPPYSLYINRPLGRVFAAAANAAGLRPNHVTMISAGFTFAALLLLALGPASVLTGVLVAFGLVLGYALDSADGQLARLQGGGSLTGEWLDHMIDSIKVSALHVAVLIMIARQFELSTQSWLLVPLLFMIVSAVHFFGMVLVDLLSRVQQAKGNGPAVPPVFSRRNSLLKLPTDYGALCLSFLLLGAHDVFLVCYALLAVASTGYLILVARKWYGDVRRLDSSGAGR